MRIIVINGPNINLLGMREPAIYGKHSYQDLLHLLRETAAAEGIELEVFQSNHEGALVDAIQEARTKADGILINSAAYTHTSIAILDALRAVALPAVEVHLSQLGEREAFRQVSYAGMACLHTIMGQGIEGYREGLLWLKTYLLSPETRSSPAPKTQGGGGR